MGPQPVCPASQPVRSHGRGLRSPLSLLPGFCSKPKPCFHRTATGPPAPSTRARPRPSLCQSHPPSHLDGTCWCHRREPRGGASCPGGRLLPPAKQPELATGQTLGLSVGAAHQAHELLCVALTATLTEEGRDFPKVTALSSRACLTAGPHSLTPKGAPTGQTGREQQGAGEEGAEVGRAWEGAREPGKGAEQECHLARDYREQVGGSRVGRDVSWEPREETGQRHQGGAVVPMWSVRGAQQGWPWVWASPQCPRLTRDSSRSQGCESWLAPPNLLASDA